jgi:hypothetical protein
MSWLTIVITTPQVLDEPYDCLQVRRDGPYAEASSK